MWGVSHSTNNTHLHGGRFPICNMFSAARTFERLLAFYFRAQCIFVVCFVVHAAPFFHYADPLAFLIPFIVLDSVGRPPVGSVDVRDETATNDSGGVSCWDKHAILITLSLDLFERKHSWRMGKPVWSEPSNEIWGISTSWPKRDGRMKHHIGPHVLREKRGGT